VLYKILSKVLANLLKKVIGERISGAISFIEGRSILHNALIANEIVHHMKCKGGKHGEVALKIDISKAYDRVDWHECILCCVIRHECI